MTKVRLAGVLLLLAVLLVLPWQPHRATAVQTTCPSPVSLINGDFETPVLNDGTVVITAQTNVPGWQTTATDKKIELWRQPFNGVYAASGAQHAELNANQVSTLYQDVTTTPGQALRWELRHRGRSGNDTMSLLIGPPGGTLISQGTYTDGKAAWGTWSGFYTVPAGQASTRFAFQSVSAAGGSQSIGNFLDGISFGTSACLLTTTTVDKATADVGDVLTYTVTARNDGGNPVAATVLTDDLPAGVTFVPGSIRSLSGSSSTTISDGADGDIGEYDAPARTVRIRAGTGASASAGGAIPVGESRSFSYQAVIGSAAAASVLADEATATYTDALTGSRPLATSNTVTTTVAPAANLSVDAVIGAAGVVAGTTTTATVTARNAGPNPASAARISATVPAGLTNITASSPDGTCTVTGQTARCDVTTLAAGVTATMAVTADVPVTAPAGIQASLTASVASTTHEIDNTDNATSVSATVATRADLAVTMTNTAGVAGAPVTYTVTITNQGPSVARGIMLADPVNSGSTYSSGSSGCALASTGTVECSVADLNPGATATVTITMVLSSSGSGAINNAVSVTAATPDPIAANNNFSVQSAGTAVADVGVSLTLGSSSAYAGDTVPYTLTVTNNGPSAAVNVNFNTVVPPGVTIVRTSPYCTVNGCTLPYLAAGASIPLTGDAVLGAGATAGPGIASSTVISPTTDNNAANDTTTVSFTILLSADLSITQSLSNPSDASALVAGQSVEGTVTVTNNGRTRAEGVVVRQAVPTGRAVPAVSTAATGSACSYQSGSFVCLLPALAAAATWRIDFAGVLIPAGYGDAVFARTAAVSATTTDPASGNDSVTTSRAVERRADLRITETTSTPNVVQTENARFQVTVRNLGPSDAVQAVVVASASAGLLVSGGTASDGAFDPATLNWTFATLADGATATLDLVASVQSSGTLTASARLASSVSTDTASGNDSDAATVTAAAAAPALSLVNAPDVVPAADRHGVKAGSRVDYAYTVANTGNLPATGVVVTGTRGGTATCGSTSLAPGDTTNCTAGSYTVVQADVDAGQPILDTARVTAVTGVSADPALFATVVGSVPVAVLAPSLALAVTPVVSPAERAHAVAVGDRIGYAYTVSNNGTALMTGIALADTRVSAVSCPQTTLAVGVSMVCTTPAAARYTVTQADVDAAVPLTDSVTATATGGVFGPASAAVPVAAADPAISLTVTAGRAGPLSLGDTLGYAYSVLNTGNVTISGLSVADSHAERVSCPGGDLAVGASRMCTSVTPYTVTQVDVDAGGSIHDDAVATGTGPAPASLPASAQGSAPVTVVAASPRLTIVASAAITPAARQNAAAAGDQAAFSYRITNTGNVTMNDLAVDHALAGPVTCLAGTLAVGSAATCTAAASYRVTQADVDEGGVTSIAKALGRAPAETSVAVQGTGPATVTTAAITPALTITVTPVVSPAGHQTAVEKGDQIGYRYRVTNAGNVTMRQIRVEDEQTGEADCPDRTVAVGATAICESTTSYRVGQIDIDAGEPIVTSAYAYGRRSASASEMRWGPGYATTPVLLDEPALTVDVTATVTPAAHQHAAGAGDTIAYAYQVTNNGSAVMTAVGVADEPVGPVTCPSAALAIRAVMTCVASRTYTVQQSDVDSGDPVGGRVFATARAPGSGPRTFGPFTAPVPVVDGEAELGLTVTPSRAGPVSAGDTFRLRYAVTNEGNVTIASLSARDTRSGAATCSNAALPVGGAVECVSPAIAVTQADVDAGGEIRAVAAVTGVRAGTREGVPKKQAETGVPVAAAAPGLSATQTAVWRDTDGDGTLGARDDVVSTVDVRNAGNVTVIGLTVTGLPAATVCPETRIAPGERVRCVSRAYHLTGEEIASGGRTVDALAEGIALGGMEQDVDAEALGALAAPADQPRPDPDPVPPRAGPVDNPITGPRSWPLLILGFSCILGGLVLLMATRAKSMTTG
ncbi:putative repeat protein (TIGR01451 family) [Actinoplanes lutulentus]|uniref:Putative repeat protein (TIGR01451 family) n=1 Tax=Actinoplanes lutulentus TaxID=1287878 RepID=A0A327Z9N7_9ACTN|nr:DUF11 domain-containing protein [Actinoplanes lutulentus]MBB2946750.1 putative repeat protein (TIGR01451 family) [Actinoplanes lutulentus]RAK35642.1 putative repeat protein (TIGR01451 family) [Actinoplanes lutulentus]